MELQNIAEGTITIELQAADAQRLAIACLAVEMAADGSQIVLTAFFPDDEAAIRKEFSLLHGLFEAAGCAAYAQGSIGGHEEGIAATLGAIREQFRHNGTI